MIEVVLLWKDREDWGGPCHKMIDFVESSVDDDDDDDDDNDDDDILFDIVNF
jgi:hypothetical protein